MYQKVTQDKELREMKWEIIITFTVTMRQKEQNKQVTVTAQVSVFLCVFALQLYDRMSVTISSLERRGFVLARVDFYEPLTSSLPCH